MDPTLFAWTAITGLAVVLVAVGVLVYAVALYNGLVQVRHQVDQALANIDVLLRQRHDELPKLIVVVAAYSAHERDLLEHVTALRQRARDAAAGRERLACEQALSRGVGQLLLAVERYPALSAQPLFGDLTGRIAALERQIARRRNYYNDAVNLNNVRRESFPDRLFAPLARLELRPLFAAEPGERADVDIAAPTGR